MIHNQDKIQKVFVNPDGIAVVKCPGCEAVKTFKADKFKGSKHIPSVKCRCQKIFRIDIEFRKFYRKQTKLYGDYVLLPWKINRGKMMVVDVSRGGVGLKVMGMNRLAVGQEVRVSFTLDDKKTSLVERRAFVRSINKGYVGCEFFDNTIIDKALGFYLMA